MFTLHLKNAAKLLQNKLTLDCRAITVFFFKHENITHYNSAILKFKTKKKFYFLRISDDPMFCWHRNCGHSSGSLTRAGHLTADRVARYDPLSRFSTSEYFRAKRLFPFVLELSAETKWN